MPLAQHYADKGWVAITLKPAQAGGRWSFSFPWPSNSTRVEDRLSHFLLEVWSEAADDIQRLLATWGASPQGERLGPLALAAHPNVSDKQLQTCMESCLGVLLHCETADDLESVIGTVFARSLALVTTGRWGLGADWLLAYSNTLADLRAPVERVRAEQTAKFESYLREFETKRFVERDQLTAFVKELRGTLQVLGSRIECPACGKPTLPAVTSGNKGAGYFALDHNLLDDRFCTGTTLKNRFGAVYKAVPRLVLIAAAPRRHPT